MREIKSQGDLSFIPVEYFPKEYIQKFTEIKKEENGEPSKQLWHGESGNAHVVVGNATIMTPNQIKGMINELLIKVREEALIDHEEHESFPIDGDYIVIRQQEVSHWDKTLRRVQD